MTKREFYAKTVTAEDKREIWRRRRENGDSVRDISNDMRITYELVYRICAERMSDIEITGLLTNWVRSA